MQQLENSDGNHLRLIEQDIEVYERVLKISDRSGTLPKRLSRVLNALSAKTEQHEEALKIIQAISKVEMQVGKSADAGHWNHSDRKAISQVVIGMCENYLKDVSYANKYSA